MPSNVYTNVSFHLRLNICVSSRLSTFSITCPITIRYAYHSQYNTWWMRLLPIHPVAIPKKKYRINFSERWKLIKPSYQRNSYRVKFDWIPGMHRWIMQSCLCTLSSPLLQFCWQNRVCSPTLQVLEQEVQALHTEN